MSNNDGKVLNLERQRETVLSVGYGNFVATRRIVAILESQSLPKKRLRDNAAGANRLVDATAGRKTRSILITDSDHVILSALAPQTLQERLRGDRSQSSQAQRELEEGEFVS